jgi:hypothetical protein
MARLGGDRSASTRLFEAGIHALELSRDTTVDDSDSPELAARWDEELPAPTFPRPKQRSF